jgi:hypothetical protein
MHRDPIAREFYDRELKLAIARLEIDAVVHELMQWIMIRNATYQVTVEDKLHFLGRLSLLDSAAGLDALSQLALGSYADSVGARQDRIQAVPSVLRRQATFELGAMARRMGRLPESVWRFARSREVQPLHREYALRALGVYGSAEARAYLARVADDAGESDATRTAARRALAVPTLASP